MASLFDPMREAGLTCLRIQYDWRDDAFNLMASRDWSDVDWAAYGRRFSVETTLTPDGKLLNHSQVLDLYRATGLTSHLDSVLAMIRAGKHERIEGWLHPGRDISFFNNVHSSGLGLSNGYHCIRSGGLRRHEPEESELDIIFDGLNLSRGMSFKNAAAGLAFGGCKSVVVAPPVDLEDNDLLGFVAYCLDRTRSFTGPDMGLPAALADVMNERYSPNFGGGLKGNIGPSGPPTAYGNYLALKEACSAVYGSDSLNGRTVAVMGLGSVGWALAERLVGEGAGLTVSDIDTSVIDAFLRKFPTSGGLPVRVVAPDQILTVEADIFAPAALGGLFTEENIPDLRCRIVMGSANNTLRASSQEEEIRLARLMQDHGIIYQVEWVQSMGGVLSGMETYMRQQQADMANVNRIIEERVPAMTRFNLKTAATEGITPTEVAYRTLEDVIYGQRA